MNMITSFYYICAPSSHDTGFWPDSISNASGGATEALPDNNVPSPTFLLHFFFQHAFCSCDQQHLFIFFHKTIFSHSISHCKCLFNLIVELKTKLRYGKYMLLLLPDDLSSKFLCIQKCMVRYL